MSRFAALAVWGFAVAFVSLGSVDSVVAQPAAAALPAPTQAPTQAPAVCTQTIMVPQTTYKTMTVTEVVCKPVVRQQTVNVCRLVPQTEMATCRMTVLVPEQRTKPISYTACRMTYEDVTRNVTVMVPHKEVRQATRTVCKLVQSQTTKQITKDVGSWGTQSFVDCCGCTHECSVWVPKLVTEQVACTVFKPELFQEPCTVETVVCRPENRQFTQRVAKPVYETVTRNVTCTVAVPKIVEKQMARRTYKPVVEQKVVNVTAMVPTKVQRQVSVPVCTLVPKTVACGELRLRAIRHQERSGCIGWRLPLSCYRDSVSLAVFQMPEVFPLQLLPAGRHGRIDQLVGPAEGVHRLEEMGMRVGQRVEMVQAGSPCIIKLAGTRLAFREHEGICVLVRLGDAA